MFITFEGLDGAGKSTQIERLVAHLHDLQQEVLTTREPGGTPLGDALRTMLLDPEQRNLAARTEALLYAASRAQHVEQVIRPALERGGLVICDRFVDASIAYQGVGLGLGVDAVAEMNEFATSGLEPDITFLMDLPVSESRDRVFVSRQGQDPDRIEQRNVLYFEQVRQAFLHIAQMHPERIHILDARKPPDELEQEIWTLVANRVVTR